MKTKSAIILVAIVVVSLVSVACVSAYLSEASTSQKPQAMFVSYYHQLGFENDSSCTVNATQGKTQQINYTIQAYDPNFSTSSKVVIPIENLTVHSYNSFDSDLTTRIPWDSSVPQESVFNYTFSQKEVIIEPIEPFQTKSFIITLHFADNAATGRYMIGLNLDQSQYKSNHPESENVVTDLCVYVYAKGT